MAYFSVIDESDDVIIRIAFHGLLRLPDLVAAHEALSLREDALNNRRVLWDFRAARAHELRRNDLRRFADYLHGRSLSHRLAGPGAIVTARKVDQFVFEMLCTFMFFTVGLDERVFDDIEEARLWLQTPPRKPWPSPDAIWSGVRNGAEPSMDRAPAGAVTSAPHNEMGTLEQADFVGN